MIKIKIKIIENILTVCKVGIIITQLKAFIKVGRYSALLNTELYFEFFQTQVVLVSKWFLTFAYVPMLLKCFHGP